MNTRRQFLITAALGAAMACRNETPQTTATTPPSSAPAAPPTTPGAPPTFATAPVAGPPVSPATFAEAEKLMQVTMTAAEREMAAATWPRSMAPQLERRVGPRKVALAADVAPATRWNPNLSGQPVGPSRDVFVRSNGDAGALPAKDADIAYATVTQLSRWIERKKITSVHHGCNAGTHARHDPRRMRGADDRRVLEHPREAIVQSAVRTG
jgi:hypothetical protein